MKNEILKRANYRYNFDRDMYVNHNAKKAFSLEFVDDHDEEDLIDRIGQETTGSQWVFYFNSAPPEAVKRELERVLAQ